MSCRRPRSASADARAPRPRPRRAALPRALRAHAPWAAGAAALLAATWLLGVLSGWSWPDWAQEGAGPVGALLAGHVLRFLALAPAEGMFVLRGPLVLVTGLWHGGDLARYWAGAAPCLAATAALGLWLVARMRRTGASAVARAVALCLCVAAPTTLQALQIGHPEELLGAALCTASVLCAVAGRPAWAGVLLGLAIGNKAWGVLAVGPVLVALPRARLRALLVAGAVAGAVVAPILLAPSSVAAAQSQTAAFSAGAVFHPSQLWWFLGAPAHGHGALAAAGRIAPDWVGSVSHLLIAGITIPLSGLYLRRRHPGPADALLLLALLLLLRCVLDPWDIAYYTVPFLVALLAWEVLTHARVPLLALTASLTAWCVLDGAAMPALGLSPDAQALAFAAVSVPALVALAAAVYAPGLAGSLRPAFRRPAAARALS